MGTARFGCRSDGCDGVVLRRAGGNRSVYCVTTREARYRVVESRVSHMELGRTRVEHGISDLFSPRPIVPDGDTSIRQRFQPAVRQPVVETVKRMMQACMLRGCAMLVRSPFGPRGGNAR